jgi:hypothetical protein
MTDSQRVAQHDLTAAQSDYAVFLPAVSSFYSTYIGRQRFGNYVDPARMPAQLQDMEMLNIFNPQQGLFPYQWALYSAGHANLDLTKQDPREDMMRNRGAHTTLLCDSGGFQIAKGVWEADWTNPACPRAEKKRSAVIKWLDGMADYAMTLDIPTWTANVPGSTEKTGIRNYDDAVTATHYNNEYFIRHRRGVDEGGARFLNVLQGASHSEADQWYDLMKHYCDPKKYPGRHFNGWGMGGQNMCDPHLILRRLVILIHDGLLEKGVHDWMHFLGTSKLEWAVLLTDIQRAVRQYANPNFTISFDCASPFLATANGQLYHSILCEDRAKWSYQMSPTADDKRYANDNRSFRDAVMQDGIHAQFEDSPVSARMKISDVCVYAPGDKNKIGKEGKTSWDSFSYALLMGHNMWMHIESVQRANREYDRGLVPAMLVQERFDRVMFRDLVEDIFSCRDRQRSLDIIDHHSRFWQQIIGTRGLTGKRVINANTMFNSLFDTKTPDINEDGLDQTLLDRLEDDQPDT